MVEVIYHAVFDFIFLDVVLRCVLRSVYNFQSNIFFADIPDQFLVQVKVSFFSSHCVLSVVKSFIVIIITTTIIFTTTVCLFFVSTCPDLLLYPIFNFFSFLFCFALFYFLIANWLHNSFSNMKPLRLVNCFFCFVLLCFLTTNWRNI